MSLIDLPSAEWANEYADALTEAREAMEAEDLPGEMKEKAFESVDNNIAVLRYYAQSMKWSN